MVVLVEGRSYVLTEVHETTPVNDRIEDDRESRLEQKGQWVARPNTWGHLQMPGGYRKSQSMVHQCSRSRQGTEFGIQAA